MASEMATEQDHWENLERALNEMEVLNVIYGGDSDEYVRNSHALSQPPPSGTSFAIVSPGTDDLDRIKRHLELEMSSSVSGDTVLPFRDAPDLQIEVRTQIEGEATSTTNSNSFCDISSNTNTNIVLRCLLQKGYPETSSAIVTSLQIYPSLTRTSNDEITRALNEKARCLLGTEAVMDLVEETKELCISKNHKEHDQQQKEEKKHQLQQRKKKGLTSTTAEASGFGRRWIWVHHITSKDRITSILAEAEHGNLKGILKHGYPGVVLIEGKICECDAFVKWIKGNKSSALGGGFGRNWGHHVRGEINGIDNDDAFGNGNGNVNGNGNATDGNVDASSAPNHPKRCCVTLKDTDDLSVMADYCRDAGLEDEFREFALQHKAAG